MIRKGRVGEGREGKGRDRMGREERKESGMGPCTHWDFRKSAPMCESMFGWPAWLTSGFSGNLALFNVVYCHTVFIVITV